MSTECVRCGGQGYIVYVHGHYQCTYCKCVVDDCCQGEQTERKKDA